MNSPYKEAEFKLTERQRQIVRELAQGITRNRSQAWARGRHREGSDQLNRIYRELGIANRNSACGHTHGRSYWD